MAPRMIVAPFGSRAHCCSTDFELASGTPCSTQVHLDHARQLEDCNYFPELYNPHAQPIIAPKPAS
eukprot:15723641-Heterocapsa_arctica.AAC.1